MDFKATLIASALALSLTACGGSGSSSSSDTEANTDTDTNTETSDTSIYGPFSTGTASEPETVYFDLDTMTTVAITDDEASNNTTWDIAFQRTSIWLNGVQDTPVSMYFTANNSDFYDDDGNALGDRFLAATADSELDDFTAVTSADIPADEEFTADIASSVIGTTFYNYDTSSHEVTAASDAYYIVYSDSNYTRFHVTDITTSGYYISEITFGIEHQSVLDGQSEFGIEQSLTLSTSGCSDNMYVDFDTQTTATVSDDWDLMLTCTDGGAEFALTLADDATVMATDGMTYTGIDTEAAPYLAFTSDSYTSYAFDAYPWYYYDSTSHLLYSQYGVYLLKVGAETFKFQITSYYDEDGTSGSYSFRAAAIEE
ncbi:HmuY family protein [Alteromonas sp. C1M14]|uniref:HmuY family protein n=1 Tax=Alteromonas sp. C1M14 TaxID=2841567 RepID=UPI001C089D27|nr:HmuY family protein [Alteromonas sp. C1M14]MBU2979792.1 HmuY family protein [Alteromonas sp. C1M14]